MKLKKDNIIIIRVTKNEKEKLIKKSQKVAMSLQEYLIDQGLERDIVVIEDVKDFIYELRKIGNNINQLTHLANSGAIYTVDLSNVKQEIGKVWSAINDL